jgi:hypothetical protein
MGIDDEGYNGDRADSDSYGQCDVSEKRVKF